MTPVRRSAALLDGPARAGARAMLKAVGFSDEDLRKPLVGVANTWIEIGPCNLHLRELAGPVKAGIRAAGGTPMEFNTVSVSDGITMGTETWSIPPRARCLPCWPSACSAPAKWCCSWRRCCSPS